MFENVFSYLLLVFVECFQDTIHPSGQLPVEFFFVQSSKCAGRVIHQHGQS